MNIGVTQNMELRKSRNETISIWSLTPDELFELDENGFPIRGKVTTLNWDNHDIERYSNNQDYTAAFTGEALSVTINTLGGVDEESADYNPPPEYKEFSNLLKTAATASIEEGIKLGQRAGKIMAFNIIYRLKVVKIC